MTIRPAMVAALAGVWLAVGATGAQAAPLSMTVTTTVDDGGATNNTNVGSCGSGGACTLRQAVNTADIAGNAGSTITVPGGTYTVANGTSLPQIYQATTINGASNGSTVIDGGGASGATGYAFDINGSGAITINLNYLTFQNFANGNLATINANLQNAGEVLNLNNSVLKNNTSAGGAGITVGQGTLHVNNSEIKNNASTTNISGGGGELEAYGSASLVVTNSTIANNTGATSAICIGCRSATTGTTFTFTNNTISGNTFSSQAVISDAKGTAAFSYNTISNNTPGSGQAVIARTSTSGETFKGNIVSGNTGTNCSFTTGNPTTTGFNFDSGTSCHFTDLTDHQSTAVPLGPLQNNGGPTDTQALLSSSPAIDTGGSGGACTTVGGVALTSDQRGATRPQGGQCDAGAFEAPVPPPTCQDVATTTAADQAVAIALSCAGAGTTTYQLAGTPSHGTLSALDGSTGTVTYSPNAGYSGPDSFTYNAQNAGGTSANATVSITVSPAATTPTVPVVAPSTVTLTTPATKCTVPKLKGRSLSKARKALTKAHCKLGKVTKPKVKRGHKLPALVVGSSKPKAGTKLRSGAAVAVKLVAAPKKHKKR